MRASLKHKTRPVKTILFVAALQEELDALWDENSFEWSDPKYQGDAIWYREAKWENFRVIAATAGEMGLVASGIVTTKLILRWRPEIVIDFGLCAGRSTMVEMKTDRRTKKHPLLRGDIIASTACFLYAAGFIKENELKQFRTARCKAEKRASEFVKKAKANWNATWMIVSKPTECAHEPTPQIFFGEYAAADYLMRNANVMGKIAENHKNFRALEMESYAVAKSAEVLGVPFGALIVKGILDNGTAEKNDAKRVFALTASRAFAVCLAKEFMRTTRGKISGWHKRSLPTLVLPKKKVLVLSSSKDMFEMLSKELGTSKLRGMPEGLPPIHVRLNKSLVLAETSAKRPCGQADFAIWSTYYISKCEPKLVLVSGLCLGIPKEEKAKPGKPKSVKYYTGDLLLVTRAFHHQFGAMTDGKSLEREIRSVDLNDTLRNFLQAIHAETIKKWSNNFPSTFVEKHARARKPTFASRCHIEPVASSDHLIKDQSFQDHISEFDRKVRGVDIEAYAIMRSAQHCCVDLGAQLVRGISSNLNPKCGEKYKTFCRALSVNTVVQLMNNTDLRKLL